MESQSVSDHSSEADILIEAINLMLPSGTGIATYTRTLAQVLSSLGFELRALLGSHRAASRTDPELSEIGLFDAEPPPSLGRSIKTEWRRITALPISVVPVNVSKPSVVASPISKALSSFSGLSIVPHLVEREQAHFRRYGRRLMLKFDRPPRLFHATRPAPLAVRGCPNIYTIHDIVPLRLPATTADDKKYVLHMIRDLCAKADHIVTVSEFSRQDIIRFTGIDEGRITNTYQSVEIPRDLAERDESVVARDIAALFGLEMRGYFLFVGALEPKKNVSRLIDAHAASGSKYPLILTGSAGWMNEDIIKKINDERFLTYEMNGSRITRRRSVRQLPYLPPDHLISLIRGARALMFPSLYEGFGLPVLEAMLLGTPVLTSNVSSLQEIAKDAAVLVDPYDLEAITRGLRQLDSDADLRAELIRRGRERAKAFSVERYAERIDALYKSLI